MGGEPFLCCIHTHTRTQNSTLVDDLLGEVQNIKSAVTGCENSVSQLQNQVGPRHMRGNQHTPLQCVCCSICATHSLLSPRLLHSQLASDISSITEQLKVLEELKMAAAKDSMGEAAAGI